MSRFPRLTRASRPSCFALAMIGLILSATAVQAGEAYATDEIVTRQRSFRAKVFSEKTDVIEYRVDPRVPLATIQARDLTEPIRYGGMQGGLYAAGIKDKNSGQFGIAAARFDSLVSGAQWEWETAYGLYELGDCWELAGEYARAAEAFGRLGESLPQHRLATNARYRQGMALARSNDATRAAAVADAIDAANTTRDRSVASRALAIRAAVAVTAGNINEAAALAARVALRPAADGDIWRHWSFYWATVLEEKREFQQAADAYANMLRQLTDDPVARAEIRLGLGRSLLQNNNKEGALAQFLAIDALPYGSPTLRTRAQFEAGRLLWELGTAGASSDRPRVVEYSESRRAQARQLIDAVAAANAGPISQEAAEFQANFPQPAPVEGDEAAAPAAEAAPQPEP